MKKKYRQLLYFLDWIAVIFLLIGGINWGLVGLFNFNLVQLIFSNFSNIVYSIVGFLSVYVLGRGVTKSYMKK
jgi:hypothetical protein